MSLQAAASSCDILPAILRYYVSLMGSPHADECSSLVKCAYSNSNEETTAARKILCECIKLVGRNISTYKSSVHYITHFEFSPNFDDYFIRYGCIPLTNWKETVIELQELLHLHHVLSVNTKTIIDALNSNSKDFNMVFTIVLIHSLSNNVPFYRHFQSKPILMSSKDITSKCE